MPCKRKHRAHAKGSAAKQHADGLYLSPNLVLQRRPNHSHGAELRRQRRHHQAYAKPNVRGAERQHRAHGQPAAQRRLDGAHHQLDLIRYSVPVGKYRAAHRHRAGGDQRQAQRHIRSRKRQYRAHSQLRRADDQCDPRKRILKRRFKRVSEVLESSGKRPLFKHTSDAAAGTATGTTTGATAAAGIRHVIQLVDLVKPHDRALHVVNGIAHRIGCVSCGIAHRAAPARRSPNRCRICRLSADSRDEHVEVIDNRHKYVNDMVQRRLQRLHKRPHQRAQAVLQVLRARRQSVHAGRKAPVHRVAPLVQVFLALAEAFGDGADHRANHAVTGNAQH